MRSEQELAEGNLACIADALNMWAREYNQAEESDYLGFCKLRDALDRIVGAIAARCLTAERNLSDLRIAAREAVEWFNDFLGEGGQPGNVYEIRDKLREAVKP